MGAVEEKADPSAWSTPVRHIVGYLASVLAATVASSILLGVVLAAVLDARLGFQFFFVVLIVGVYVFVTAIPGFILTLLVARRADFTHWLYFAIAGGLNGALVLCIIGGGIPANAADLAFLMCAVIGGFFGGLAYWRVAHMRG